MIQRPQQSPVVGTVILGRVKKIVSGLNGAFVDIGDERDGFLPFPANKRKTPSMGEGEAVVVRVRRESMGNKGARLAPDNRIPDNQVAGRSPPAVLTDGPDVINRLAGSLCDRPVSTVIVDGAHALAALVEMLPPDIRDLPERHPGPDPLFDARGIEELIDAALNPVVSLPSGGLLHFRETPACVTVDVDGGTAPEGRQKAEMVRTVNRQAATMIAQELRSRNLSGSIVIDFIASKNRKDGAALLDLLRIATATDTMPVDVRGWSRMGLVEMVRQRHSPSLSEMLCQAVPVGDGLGRMKSPVTLAYAALRQASAEGRRSPGRAVTVKCPDAVYMLLVSCLSDDVTAIRERLGSRLNIVRDAAMPMDGLDVYTGA